MLKSSDSKIKLCKDNKTTTSNDEREPRVIGDCGCRHTHHSTSCLRLRGGAGHGRQPNNAPAPQLNPDPDFLKPHLLRPIIPIIQALNQKFSNRQNRWIAHLGPPRILLNIQNNLWPRVTNSFQIPTTLSEERFQDLFYFSRQQAYQLRNSITYPMLQARVAQAQGARGALSSIPHSLTPDSLTCLFLGKVRLNHTDRTFAAELGVDTTVVRKWTKALRDYYFTTDPFIQRNINLHDPANLRALLEQGIDATARDQRTMALYSHLTIPGTRLLVAIMDSRAVKIQQSQDPHLQKRTISTKIKNNSVQKMTVSTCEGIPMVTFPLMCSISPAGTDESNCEHLITIHEGGIYGGLMAFMESPLTEPVTLVLLQDQGFRKFGFDHANRRSFIDYQDNLQNRSNNAFRYFTPCFASDQYRDRNFNTVARYLDIPGGARHRCRTANTSSACCTKTRWSVESLFSKEHQLKLLGSATEVSQQFLSSCRIPNYESQSVLSVWLHIGDSLLFHHGTPLTHTYNTVDTYFDHGNDIRERMEKENPLSEYSRITWSRPNIFKKPRRNELTSQGQIIHQVFLLNPQQTGMMAVTVQEFSSITLGSFQPRMVRQYRTKLR